MTGLIRRIQALALIALTAALPAQTAQASESAFADIQRILDAGSIRVAILGQDAAPMIMTAEDGSPGGSEADLARDLAKKLGVEVEFIRTAETYDAVVAQVAAKEADLGVSFLSSGVARAMQVYFSRPYIRQSGRVFYSRTGFARLKRDYKIKTLREIDDSAAKDVIQIGVLDGSIYEGVLERDLPGYHIKQFGSLPELMQAVREGRIFAGFHGGLQIDFYMRQNPSTAIHVAVDPELRRPSDICIAVRPDAPNLLRWVDVYLANSVGLEDAKALVDRYVEKQEAQAEAAEKAAKEEAKKKPQQQEDDASDEPAEGDEAAPADAAVE
jgi:polar amino acid transport system substrate-binding protein